MRRTSRSPTVRIPDAGKFKIKFFSNDFGEPPHVHLYRDGRVIKIWLAPVFGRARQKHRNPMRPQEVRDALRFAQEHYDALLKAWHDFFAQGG